MYGDFIITSLSQRSPSYEELFLHSGHAQLKQKQKHQRSRGMVGQAAHHPCFVRPFFALTWQQFLRRLHFYINVYMDRAISKERIYGAINN